ncbi:MAG: helix-turn-helix domain-containing protein [Actinomycetota bacterium]|nr:helix-turn-helix domain-containing protein [Actinomycetota bacterium]
MTQQAGPESWAAVASAAQAALADIDGITAEAGVAVRERVPEYAYVSDEQLWAASRRNLMSLLTALMERRALNDAELRVFADTVEERARNGVPLDEYLLAVTTAEASMWDRLWASMAQTVPAEQMLQAFALRFANVKTVTRVTATAHRRIELRTSREEHERRALALRSLLRGRLVDEEIRDHSGRLGLDASRPYFVVRARGQERVDTDQVQRELAGNRSHPPYCAFALWGDDVVGLLLEAPVASGSITAGMAGPVPLAALGQANEQAQLALATAWPLGLAGVFRLSDLGLRANVQQSPEVGRELRQRYVAPLQGSGSLGGELLATVRAYLETGSRRDGAASRLHVHINTVGYRIGRFCELTGADLTDLTTLAELWWLFTDLDLRAN